MSKPAAELSPVLVVCVVALCFAGTALFLLLPAESLLIDLVYQAF